MVETHPFVKFVPRNVKYLLIGSFAGKDNTNPEYWFYVTKVNQFWPILEQVYNTDLRTREQKKSLFEKLGLAITDMIYQCERRKVSNLDNNLINIVYNTKAIEEILAKHNIKIIYFSSRFAEKLFNKIFGQTIDIKQVVLPSPSPRYAAMSKAQKIARYKEVLPVLHLGIE